MFRNEESWSEEQATVASHRSISVDPLAFQNPEFQKSLLYYKFSKRDREKKKERTERERKKKKVERKVKTIGRESYGRPTEPNSYA